MDMLFRSRRKTNSATKAYISTVLIYKRCDKGVYYRTLFRRVHITRETSTNIARYLYLVLLTSHSFPGRVKVKNRYKSEFWENKSLDNKSHIRSLMCSIAENLYS